MKPALGRRIVVGIDGIGGLSRRVLSAAVDQARWGDGELCLVHALTLTLSLPDAGDPAARGARGDRTDRPAAVHAATAELRRHLAPHLGDDRSLGTVRYDVRYGDPATVLLMAAQEADLIVLGTRDPGRTEPRSPFLLGSVSQDVALNAVCPVLLIPPQQRAR